MKYNRYTLGKLEEIFKQLGYKVRYEKGQFQSGYCIVEHKKVVVVNKFFEVEGRIHILLDILSEIQVDPNVLDEKMRAFYRKVMHSQSNLQEEE